MKRKQFIMGLVLLVILSITIESKNTQEYSLDSSQYASTQLYNEGSFTLREEWKFKFKNQVWKAGAAPICIDLDGNGLLEIIVGSENKYMYCFNVEGKKLWSFESHGIVHQGASAADLDRDGRVEILQMINGILHCINYEGEILWQFETNNWYDTTSPSIADLDSDGLFEILLPTDEGPLYCLDYEGNVEWSFPTSAGVFSRPTVTDLNDDGLLEVIFGCGDHNIYCLNFSGDIIWTHPTGNTGSFTPIVADINNDLSLEIVAPSHDGFVYCLDENGTIIWTYEIGEAIYNLMSSDINNDGFLEIIVGGDDDNSYCLNSSGSLLWTFFIPFPLNAPAAGDLNNDGKPEIIYYSSMGLQIVDYLGKSLSNHSFIDWAYSTTPTIADIDMDGKLEIILHCIEYLFCLELEENTSKQLIWPCVGGSAFLTNNQDGDMDYLDDITEKTLLTDPKAKDSDSDGIPDGLEFFSGLDPLVKDSQLDHDADGLTNLEEIMIYHSSIFSEDSDGDDHSDLWEAEHGTNPMKFDNWNLVFGFYLVPVYISIPLFYLIAYVTKVFTRIRIRAKMSKEYRKFRKKQDSKIIELEDENVSCMVTRLPINFKRKDYLACPSCLNAAEKIQLALWIQSHHTCPICRKELTIDSCLVIKQKEQISPQTSSKKKRSK